jgi:hypothetical protein
VRPHPVGFRNSPLRKLRDYRFHLSPRACLAGRRSLDAHVERHRVALIALGVSTGVDRDAWIEGFRCELKVEAINRIGLQLLFAAQLPLAYLARINSNIERLLDMYE